MTHRGPYEFDREDAIRFSNEQMIPTKQRGDELMFKECPYCHGRGKGNEYKFSINLKTGLYKCMRASCGAHGNMIDIARDFGFDIGRDLDYYQPRKVFREFKRPEKKIEPKDEAIKYLESRGISRRIAEEYEITVKPDDGNILIFPFYAEDGSIIPMIKYRAIKTAPKGSKEWYEKDCKPILFGMNHCETGFPLIITEGQIDSLSLAEAGIKNAVSVPGGKSNFTWVPYCWDFVSQFSEIIVFGDHERGEITLLDDITKRFGKRAIVKHVRPEDYQDCKDANDILRKYGTDQLRKCIYNAAIVPMKILKDLADVVPPSDTPKLVTGIRELDNLLHGGLPFGMYHVVGGKRGNGKSTLASQILARALDQGYTCMAYSGELNDYNFKFWLDCQLAGPNHVIEDPKTIGKEYHDYLIPSHIQKRITEWYRGRCLIYDNTVIHVADEETRLIDIIDEAIRRYGVRVVLLDNLMTAMHKEGLTEYRTELERQGAFVDRLADVAQETGAMIILVAHKRKESLGGTDASDDISGNSQITNYAGVVMSYDRYSDKEIKEADYLEECRRLTVSKNRLYGNVNTKGIMMSFDAKSRRIWGGSLSRSEQNDFTHKYGWEIQEEPTIDYSTAEIPFE